MFFAESALSLQSSITASRKEPAASQGNNGKDLTAKLLSLCDGSRCYDAIACAIGLSIEEVENECTNGAHKEEIIIICRMSAAGSNPDNP
ncbi:hypothetical protein GUITHDRAFT_111857 [Guillardia theta CCMP2712]|uniref:Uncharacterized protein n=1 Tax=Guillardia theta (strain CCMP2712) TaxID=905079 RepID=L1J0E4_GUITC|nr:hypothetical protein GUITHDRAFT_111857 [Guillardia theta CCMP2712]EKX42003.1 hypothetical protein GUITHDRAFT_111857 [Guillardia theta CCMP2712]|eukprot:XP_005828983.1 hypothetical protein GUITHDRAFT_111857 [Guillardia theta CCMP2712]